MKKALIALALPLSLIACGSGSDTDAVENSMEEVESASVTIVTPMNGAQISGKIHKLIDLRGLEVIIRCVAPG